VGVALAAGLLFLALKMFVFNGTAVATAETKATLVVMVGDKKVADVFLNGEKVGPMEAGEDLTVGDLEPGKYDIRVERKGVDACSDSITVTSERVKYYNCEFVTPADASLLIEGLRETDSVLVDGQQVPTSSLNAALPMHAGKTQTVAISREGKLVDEFTVTLKSGEERRHQVAEVAEPEDPDEKKGPETEPPTVPVKEPKPLKDYSADPKPADSGDSPESKTVAPVRKRPVVDLSGDAPLPKPRTRAPEPVEDEPIATPVVTDTHGYLTAVTRPWARIFVDGKDTGKQTPVTEGGKIKLKPGMHKVTFVSEGKKYNFSVTIEAGKTKRLIKSLVVVP
jgi:uncharacterized cupredoxin-like copper-binding protein